MTEEKNSSRWVVNNEKGKRKVEFRDVTPKDNEKAMERYIDKIPDIFVDKFEKYLNTHKEDDELTKRYPDDFDRSVRVLPLEKDGKRYLRMVATNEKKTEDFYQFLKEGDFKFENEIVEGVERESVIDAIKRRIKDDMDDIKEDDFKEVKK